jgi:hypothetical protein
MIMMPGATLEVTYQRAEHIRQAAQTLELLHNGQSLGSLTLC